MSDPKSTYHFEGNIVIPEGKPYGQDYMQISFLVPAGMNELRAHLRYEPAKVDGVSNLITLGLFDPTGFRGNAHRQPPDEEIVIGPAEASPGFLPGIIQEGEWVALLAAHAVLRDEKPCCYTLDITCSAINSLKPTKHTERTHPDQGILDHRAGWYCGDLHSHTLHSDGALRCEELVQSAQKEKLDFLAITDHNTNSVLSELTDYISPEQKPLMIPGIELTTFWGHALALGVTDWVDWRTGLNGWTMTDAAKAVHALGGLFIVAHPKDVGTPVCTGCRWEYDAFDFGQADGLEIWNGQWEVGNEKNPSSLHMWRELQKGIKHITATAGSDFHSPQDWAKGVPRVYVYAENLSVEAILSGIRKGRVIVSSEGKINLVISADEGAQTGRIGETIMIKNSKIDIAMDWMEVAEGARLILRDSQGIVHSQTVSGTGKLNLQLNCQFENRFWLELFAEDGTLLALSNPVYVESEKNV